MLALAFLKWWYGPGWAQGATSLAPRLRRTYYGFSVPQLVQTLFAPWRRIMTPGGGALSDRLRAVVDNMVSRFIGAIVRLLTIGVAFIIAAGWIIFAGIRVVIWPFLPLAAVGLIVWGVA